MDAQILFAQLERVLFSTTELREHQWIPMQANPGRAIYLLLARDFGRCRRLRRPVSRRPPSRTRWRRPGRWPTPGCPRCIWRPRSTSSPDGAADRAGTGPYAGRGAGRSAAGRAGRRAGDGADRGAGRDRGASALAGAAAGGRHPGPGFRDPRIGPGTVRAQLFHALESGTYRKNSWAGPWPTWMRRRARSPRPRPGWPRLRGWRGRGGAAGDMAAAAAGTAATAAPGNWSAGGGQAGRGRAGRPDDPRAGRAGRSHQAGVYRRKRW